MARAATKTKEPAATEKVKKTPVQKTETPKDKSADSVKVGRRPTEETQAWMNSMIESVKREPGIGSAELARLLGISTMVCSTLAHRLVKQERLKLERKGRRLFLYPA